VSYSVPVNLIRQWCYCPRIVYYIELTDVAVTYPGWVAQGEKFHKYETKMWKRRNLSRFNLDNGDLFFNVHGKSDKYNIHGVFDMLIETEDAVYPVEFKLSSSLKKKGGIFQLVAYGIIADDIFNKPCNYGFFAEGEKLLQKVEFTEDIKNSVLIKAEEIREMIKKGVKPDTSATVFQCTNCEYLNYCNDRC